MLYSIDMNTDIQYSTYYYNNNVVWYSEQNKYTNQK